MSIIRSSCTLLCAVLLSVGCGNNNANNGPPSNTNGDMGNNGANNGANNGEPDMGDNNGVDPGDEGCDGLIDLGSPADETFQQPFHATVAVENPACVGANEGDGSVVFKLRYEAPTRVTITTDGIPKFVDDIELPPQPVVEVRAESCASPSMTLNCAAERVQTFDLEGGVSYYIAVAGRLDSNGVKLQVRTAELVCESGTSMCVDGVLELCEDGTTVRQRSCAGTCKDESACAGDGCEDAVEIALTPGGAEVVLSGNRQPYSSTWNAKDRPGCGIGPGAETGTDTPRQDIFLKIPGLTTGQTLHILNENDEGTQGVYNFYLLDACDAAGCVGAYDFNDGFDNALAWTVTQDGDVYVVVEALGDLPQPYELHLTLDP